MVGIVNCVSRAADKQSLVVSSLLTVLIQRSGKRNKKSRDRRERKRIESLVELGIEIKINGITKHCDLKRISRALVVIGA